MFAVGSWSGWPSAGRRCFHWPRASWWSVEQPRSSPFTSIPPRATDSSFPGLFFPCCLKRACGEAQSVLRPPTLYVYLGPQMKVQGRRLLGALGTEGSLSSGSSQADGQDTASNPRKQAWKQRNRCHITFTTD